LIQGHCLVKKKNREVGKKKGLQRSEDPNRPKVGTLKGGGKRGGQGRGMDDLWRGVVHD